MPRTGRKLSAIWLLGGVSALFGFAVYRLGGRGLTTIGEGLSGGEWVALVALTAGFVYAEGVMALGRRWVPHLLRRARRVQRERQPILHLLAPLYGLSLVGASRRRMARAWMGTLAILVAAVAVQSLPRPWRGIVDFAVAAALGWGLVAIARGAPSVFRPGVPRISRAHPTPKPTPSS